ncbi:MAG: phage portal protein [Aristaeellaceae bacterium]
MFTDITWQDFLAASDREALLLEAIRRYKASPAFRRALEANCYFRGENTQVARKTILRARKVEGVDANGRRRVRTGMEDVVGNRIASAFLFRFVTQQNQFLLSEGVSLPAECRNALGADFDHQLEHLGECALLQGCAWGFWNADHIEIIEAAKNVFSGFFPLLDEMSGEMMLGVQFWQIAPERPMYVRIFDREGVRVLREDRKGLSVVIDHEPYRRTRSEDALASEIITEAGYGRLPLIPLKANPDGTSELTPAIKAKIDAYDAILSDFADNLDRANDVYWVLNNFGGTMDEVAELLEQINRVKAVANLSDGSGSSATAEPRTIEVPYIARREALNLLERALYQDYMALDMNAITGGSLTNVAIRAAAANLNLKADRYEWQVRQFVMELLRLIGHPTEDIRFSRQTITNESEVVQDIYAMRQDIDQRTALRLNPYIQEEEIEPLMEEALE